MGGISATEDVQHCEQAIGQIRRAICAHVADGHQVVLR
jgi:hypothetical protein